MPALRRRWNEVVQSRYEPPRRARGRFVQVAGYAAATVGTQATVRNDLEAKMKCLTPSEKTMPSATLVDPANPVFWTMRLSEPSLNARLSLGRFFFLSHPVGFYVSECLYFSLRATLL